MDEDANDNVDAWVAEMDAARVKARRERIATAVLAGFAAHSGYSTDEGRAKAAIKWADILIAELDKSERK